MRSASLVDHFNARRKPSLLGIAMVSAAGLLLLGSGPLASQPAPAFACVSRPSELRELGFSGRGAIAEVVVKPGDAVKAGDRLARLDDRVQTCTVDLAKLQAEDTTKVRQAQAGLEFRQQELQLLEAVKSASAGNASELREARYRRESAAIELEAAHQQARADQVMLLREQGRLDELRLVSPIDATVLEVHKRAGETVDQGTTVVTLISVDPLWLDVNLPTKAAATVEVGRKATVEWEDIDGVGPMPGTVIFKSPAANAGARIVQLRVEVPNPRKVPGGLHGNVTFQPLGTPVPTGGGPRN